MQSSRLMNECLYLGCSDIRKIMRKKDSNIEVEFRNFNLHNDTNSIVFIISIIDEYFYGNLEKLNF